MDIHTEVVKKLQAAQLKISVVKFGSKLPKAPYCVVKEEYSQLQHRQLFRIIAHFEQGQQQQQKEYVRKTVYDALHKAEIVDEFNAHVCTVWVQNRDLGTLTIASDDSTISRESVYFVPDAMQIVI